MIFTVENKRYPIKEDHLTVLFQGKNKVAQNNNSDFSVSKHTCLWYKVQFLDQEPGRLL